MTYVWNFFDPTASAMAYGQRPKFFRAGHSATAEGENYAYGPTLWTGFTYLLQSIFSVPDSKRSTKE